MPETSEPKVARIQVSVADGEIIAGLVTLRYTAEGELLVLSHSSPGHVFPPDAPLALRALADELDVQAMRRFLEAAPDAG